jgi:DNA (cytosine-5)-methyltransferase 1
VSAYYNEIDPYAAAWLRNLIGAGHIAAGDVDERSIVDVRPDDLRGYTQCHFFAGIGGWSLALRLAGWPDDRPVWTGSCPCQPFSAAGAGKAADDERHLWPAWFPLIAECRPAIVFGEQVEAAVGWGWLDAVFADLEGEGYACGAAVLPACGVGAPHIRQRCWFVADAGHDGRAAWASRSEHEPEPSIGKERGSRCADGELAHANGRDASPEGLQRGGEHGQRAQDGRAGRVGDTRSTRLSQRECDGRVQREAMGPQPRQAAVSRGNPWHCEWLPCTDGKARPVEPGTFPLAHGIPDRVGRLRAYGNAITPQCAAEFIEAVSTGR